MPPPPSAEPEPLSPGGRRRFCCAHLGVPPPPPEVRIVFAPVAERVIGEISRDVARKLTEPMPPLPPELEAKVGPRDVVEGPPLGLKFEIAPYPPLHALARRFGQTAMVVQWMHRMVVEEDTGRREGALQAVSLYLTGLDRAADNCAVAACRGMRSGSGGNPLPVPPQAWQEIVDDPKRPLAVQVFVQAPARLDQSVRCAFLGMGVAFFGSLGGVEEVPDEEPPAGEQQNNEPRP